MNENEIVAEEIEELEAEETDETGRKVFHYLMTVVLKRVMDCSHDIAQMKPDDVTMKDKYDLGKEVQSIVDGIKDEFDVNDLDEESKLDLMIMIEEGIVAISHLYQRLSETGIESLEEMRLEDLEDLKVEE